jgi:hypothetical protein
MPDGNDETISSRRQFIRSAWAVPVVATFALGASAIPASSKPVTANSTGPENPLCFLVEKEPFANKGLIEALLGCRPK